MKYVVAAVGALWAASACAFAQSDAALLLKPWEDGNRFEMSVQTMMFHNDAGVAERGPVSFLGKNGDVAMHWSESTGRGRLDTRPNALTAGFEVSHIEFHADGRESGFADDALEAFNFPNRLSDFSMAVGMGIGEWNEWELAGTVGFGTAGEELNHPEARYALASLVAAREMNTDMSVRLVLDYDGNRYFLPDVPLPGVAFNHRVNEALWYSAGFPRSAIRWEVLPSVVFDAQYAFPYTVNARLGWRIIKPLEVFAAYQDRVQRFWNDDPGSNIGPDQHYLHLQQQRLEAGFRVTFCDSFDLTLARGYAFNTDMSIGWDVRNTQTLFVIDDEEYWRFGAEVRF